MDNKIKEEASAIFAKIYLVNNDLEEAKADKVLVDWVLGIGGSFYTKIIDAMWSADFKNKERLIMAFPELNSIFRYMNEEGYWEEFKKKYLDGTGI